MRLSEAGLLGNMAVERCEGKLIHSNSACFLGGALLAIGAIKLGLLSDQEEQEAYEILKQQWPILETRVADNQIPFVNCSSRGVMQIIWELNDTRHWTRPQIAAWVATIEAQYMPQVSPATCEIAAEMQEV